MKDKRISGSWRTAWECLLASMALAVLTLVSFRLHAGPAMAALLFFFLVILISLWAGFLPTAFACAVAALCYVYFFTQPLYHLWMSEPVEIAATMAFSGTALIISRLIARVRERTAEVQQTNEQLQAEIAERRRAEERVRQSEAELRRLIDAIPQHVVVVKTDGSFLYVNQVALEYTGLTLEDSLSKDSLAKIFHPDDVEKVVAERQQAISRGLPWHAEVRIRGKDGNYRWFMIRLNPLRDEQGRVLRWYGTRTDIEDRKRAEEALRQSETKLRREQSILTEAEKLSHTGAWEWDVVSGAWSFSDEWLRIHGTDRKTLTPEELILIAHPDDRPSILQAFEEVRKGERPYNIEHRIIQQDTGKVRVVRASGIFVRDEEGKVAKVYGCAQDITEQKQAEEALLRLNRELRALSNCNQTLLHATDEQSLLHEICRIVCEEAGYRVAWVGYAEHNEAKSVRPVAWTGTEEEDVANLGITWADTERGRGIIATAIRSGKTCCIKDYATDPEVAPGRESALQHGFRSGIALPLKDEHTNIFGSLNIYSAQPNTFTSEEIRLLEELAADLAFGIITLRSRAARERAEQEVALLSFAVDNVRETALLIDDRGRFQYVNEEACRVLDYTRAQLLGMGVADIDPEFPAERWSDHWRDLQAQRSLSFESRHRTRDGNTFPVEVSANYFEYGGRAYNLALVRDITERKRAEEALRRSEAYLASAQKLTHTGAYVMKGTSREPIYWSEEMFRLFGTDPEEGLLKRDQVWQRIPPEDHDKVKEASDRVFLEKVDSEVEYRIVLPDGTVKLVHTQAHPVLSANGEVAEVVATMLDITERRRAEEALRRSEAYLAEAQRLTHTGAWATDPAPEPLYWSEELFRLYGLDSQDGLPTHDQAMQRVHPEDRDKYARAFHRVIDQKVDSDVEFRTVLPDGAIRYLHGLGHPVLNAHGELVEVVGTTVDITDRKRAEEALRAQAALLDLTHDTVFVTDMEGVIKYWNRGAEERYGWTAEHALGRVVHDLLKTVFPGPLEEIRAEVSRTGRWEGEILHTKKDGTQVVVASRWALQRDERGAPMAILETNNDITLRKRAEEALRLSNAYNRSLIEASLDPLVTIGPDGKIMDVNAATEAATGRSRGELVGTDFCDYFTEPAKARAGYEQVFREGLVRDYPLELRHRDGGVMPVLYNASVYRDESGRVAGVFAAARDITERQRAEEALRESETRFRTFVDHAADALFIQDFEQGTIIEVNRRACESLGYTRQELVGTTPLAFDVNLDQAALESIAERAAAGETALFDRHWHRRKDGSRFPVEVHISTFWHRGHRFLLKIARDISDRLQAEEQRARLRQLEADVAHMDRVSMMGELAASIAHEVNQPLSGVVVNANACLRWLAGASPNLDEAREAVRRIVRDGKRAGDVIARIRALATKTATAKERLDMNETIREIIALAGDELRKNRVAVRTELAPDLLPVLGDRVQLQQVVLNLVMNGVEAMRGVEERPRELIVRTQNDDAGQVRVTVRDSGIGLDPQSLERMFEAFYTTKHGGMGLGLSISRSIIQNHGGKLWAVANEGPGISVQFTIPKHQQ
jgi:PAS domain S-box-containing protein